MRFRICFIGLVFLSMGNAQNIPDVDCKSYLINTLGVGLQVTLPSPFEQQSASKYYESFTDGFTFIKIGKAPEGYEEYVYYLKESESEYTSIFSSSTDLKFKWFSSKELNFTNLENFVYCMQKMSMMHASQPLIALHLIAEDKQGAFYAEARITASDEDSQNADMRISEVKKIFSSLVRVYAE
jgi:hypothetical protein